MALHLINKFRNNFIAGLVVILPIILTIYLFRILVITTNEILINPIQHNIGLYPATPFTLLAIKTLLFLSLIAVITIIGVAAKLIFINKIFSIPDKLFLRVPLIGKIYLAMKQLSFAFLGQGVSIFKKVILVEYPRKGIYSIGFKVADVYGEINSKTSKEMISIFVPTTPNPTSGVYLLIPKEDAIPLDMSVADGLKMVISGGGIIPKYSDT